MTTIARPASNGRPEAEVIANVLTNVPRSHPKHPNPQFSDGLSYSKGKLEQALMSGILERPPIASSKENLRCKKEDVDLIVLELEVTRLQAEKALSEHGHDVVKALGALVLRSP